MAYGELLASDVLYAPLLGSVNLHFSLLPRWRGASPVQHAILEGDAVTGVTVIRMDEGMDTGPVLARREEAIRSDDDAGSLGARLAAIGADAVAEVLLRLSLEDVTPTPQAGTPTLAPKLGTSGSRRRLDATRRTPSYVAYGRSRPTPGRTRRSEGMTSSCSVPRRADGTTVHPARSSTSTEAGWWRRRVTGAVRLLEVAATGRRRMPAADWARGVRDLPGDRFGT